MAKRTSRLGSDPLHELSWISSTVKQELPSRSGLRPIQFIDPSLLKKNPLNELFSSESDEYFITLKNDIQERGIIVPLIARSDYLLVAGHNRLKVALELQLTVVPVQFALDDLTIQQERELLFKDNILRRQLTALDKETLIRAAYATELFEDNRGGDRKSSESKIKSSTELLIPLPERIESELGIKAGTVKRILSKIRKDISEESKDNHISDSTKKRPEKEVKLISKTTAISKIKASFATIETMLLNTNTKHIDSLFDEISQHTEELRKKFHNK